MALELTLLLDSVTLSSTVAVALDTNYSYRSMTTVVHDIGGAVGAFLSEIREQFHLSQEDVAIAARQLGLNWSRSTIDFIENGGRRIEAAELLLLPDVARLATDAGLVTTVSAILERTPWLRLSDKAVVQRSKIDLLLTGPSEQIIVQVKGPGGRSKSRSSVSETDLRLESAGEAEKKAARRLRRDVLEVAATARALWGRSLTAERELRMEAESQSPWTSRSRQAVRGHVTRRLLDELATELDGRH